MNVTGTDEKNGKTLVTELDHLVTEQYASTFYDSCKDVKFGATNGKAIDLIGGGAENYTEFLKFLGDQKPFGSPFQMNFPPPGKERFKDFVPMHDKGRKCNDTDEKYRCSCVDCAASCPELPEVQDVDACTVGVLPCLSFAVIIVYAVFLGLLVTAVMSHAALKRRSQQKNDRLRLLQDVAPSDDEDEGDMIDNMALMDRPQQRYIINDILDRVFYTIGRFCAEFPALVIGFSIFMVLLLSLGWIRFSVETDPVRLWVAPDSAAALEKQFFDENFGPFWRIEQAFLVNDTQPSGPGPVLSYETLRWWFDVESRVKRLISLHGGTTLDDICYKPTGDACVVESVTGYFGGSFANVDQYTWQQDLKRCVEQPVACLPDFQQPLRPDLLFGGQYDDVLDAEAIVVLWLVMNHQVGTVKEKKATEWEKSLKNLLRAVQEEAKDRGLRLSFNTEMSLEAELNKSTNTDAKIIVISYLVMFLYSSVALGSTTMAFKSILRNPANAFVQSKFSLGVMGILIVLMSVSASVGLFSAANVPVTLIIAEVIPFLVLAVGVDNIFLLAHEFERINVSHAEKKIPERVAKTLGRMGPSILLSATTETVAFALGAFVGMPAVRNFAAYAAGAVFINALLQVTMFVSVLALNQQRMESSRADCIPCITIKNADSPLAGANGADLPYGVDDEGPIDMFIRKVYAPALLGKKVKVVVMVLFLGIFTAGLALLPDIKLGLDQRIAVPSDSYLIDYFNDLDHYFNAGPPVYFVTKDLNVTDRAHQQELCGRFSTCKEFSLANILEQERKRPEVSYIAGSTASWVDDYLLWLNPSLEDCCVDGSHTCFANRDPPWNITLYGMPEGREFIQYLKRWLVAPTNEDCPLAGQAAYGDAVVVDQADVTIPASHFRTSHTSLHTQSDYIEAYRSARRIADEISAQNGNAQVFPYSKFYIFFDQYLSIVHLSAALVGSALAAIFALSSVLLGSITTALVVTCTVLMTVVDILGTMAVANVSLNAVSLVNLVICTGIAFEFCAHIARAFTFPSRAAMERAPRPRHRYHVLNGNADAGGSVAARSDKDVRAWAALANVGASVFSGITLTKFLGVTVLAFTRSKIFEIYYFRVWLALIVWAAAHALVFLPVGLSLVGGRGMYYIFPVSFKSPSCCRLLCLFRF